VRERAPHHHEQQRDGEREELYWTTSRNAG
jgi:hypothetical protein